MNNKIFSQILGGMFGGSVFGIFSFFQMIILGEINGGCFLFADTIFGTAGYESCGLFGALIGIFFGALVGIVSIGMIKINNHNKINFFLIIGSIFAPLVYNVLRFFPESLMDFDVLFVLPVTIIFNILSAFFSAILILFFHLINKTLGQLSKK